MQWELDFKSFFSASVRDRFPGAARGNSGSRVHDLQEGEQDREKARRLKRWARLTLVPAGPP